MAEPHSEIFIYDVADGDSHKYYVSPLPYAHGFSASLPAQAIMGTLLDGPERIAPDSFRPNSRFRQFLASVIAKHGNSCPGLLAEAERQQVGYVYILDLRTATPDGYVPPEDIIGGFEVANGALVRFHPSPNHQLLTPCGFMQLDPFFNERLISELIACSDNDEMPATDVNA